MKCLQGVNATPAGGMAIMQEIVLKGEDQIQEDIIIVKEDIEAVLEVTDIIIKEDIGLLDLQAEGVQEEVREGIEGEVIVEEVGGVEAGVEAVIIEGLEVEKVEKNLMIVKIREIMMIINHIVKKVEAEIIVIIIILILKMIKIIIMKKQII
jgi:hypothetical protein